MAHPSLYNADKHCDQIIQFGRDGLTVWEMAEKLDVTKRTLYEWAKKYPEFADAFDKARDYSKAWMLRDLRENRREKFYQFKSIEMIGRFNHELRMPGWSKCESWSDKVNYVMEAVENGDMEPAKADALINLLSTSLSIINQAEFQPVINEILAEKKAQKVSGRA